MAEAKLTPRDQAKLLQRRLEQVRGAVCQSIKHLPKPAAVKRAEATIFAYEKRNYAHRQAQRLAADAAINAVTDALILGDAPKALKLLQALEAKNG